MQVSYIWGHADPICVTPYVQGKGAAQGGATSIEFLGFFADVTSAALLRLNGGNICKRDATTVYAPVKE